MPAPTTCLAGGHVVHAVLHGKGLEVLHVRQAARRAQVDLEVAHMHHLALTQGAAVEHLAYHLAARHHLSHLR